MSSQLFCPTGTIYDPDTKMCNYKLVDVAAAQQAIANLRKQGASQILPITDTARIKNPNLVPPWVQMPDGGFPFSSNGTVNTPVVGSGWTDVIGPNGQYVMQVPNGYDGVANILACFYNGGGFISGSGQLIWRILVNGQAVRNYDNILVQLGVNPFPGNVQGIRFKSGDTVQFQVNNVSLIAGGTQIFCFLGGYYWPNKLS